MADPQHIAILKRGVEAWNSWRKANPRVVPDLTHAELSGQYLPDAKLDGADLSRADLRRAWLSGATLREARLEDARLDGAQLEVADLFCVEARRARLDGAKMHKASLYGAVLEGAFLREATLSEVNLDGADLTTAWLERADLSRATLAGAILRGAHLRDADLSAAYLNGAILMGADLTGARLYHAKLCDSILVKARLCHSDMNRADLVGADLRGADLAYANLVETALDRSVIDGCRVYGVSAWNIQGQPRSQSDLIVTPSNEPAVTVGNLEVAQFVYLLLHNKKIRHVIDTITSKVVLILGRFTPERKPVIDALRETLGREHDYVPIAFDFDKPATRDTQETITFLARMARFIIADITDAKSIPQELGDIVPDLPSVPVQPILQEGGEPWGMYDRISRYSWVLPIERYATFEQLLPRLHERVIAPAEAKLAEIRGQT